MKALSQVLAFACALLTFATIDAEAARPPARRPTRSTARPQPRAVTTPARSKSAIAAQSRSSPRRPASRMPAASPAVAIAAPIPIPAPAPVLNATPDSLARRIVELTNAERAAVGAAPLAWSDRLAFAAEVHADDLASRGIVEHVVDGVTPYDRVATVGEAAASVGENLFRALPVAADPTLAEGVVAAWMNSPDHRDNILDPAFTELGVGVSLDPIPADPSTRDLFAVQVFARPIR
ncbi:CAP domain-containing protein [Paludisphaera soli]|uniref:CAP domain-containing protein n=1 Tax=Paludisphaera soli TaxID=2712865 RepID=UPI0013EBF8A7|nr:CAP domain-containing protein [Paludisphaera soli]